ncbi:hypothetical protein PAPYR_2080 [Paratrimastix pyriformis]|uniref:Translocon-associated protein subunit gamma n=1 Tax=Paratrimastix pyriformis TaxID=342808 RepID=A0ABQ8UQS2_9EUKA|nr:hypothetical protein PAPYR_2080 [Paratrimastix pyriformis]
MLPVSHPKHDDTTGAAPTAVSGSNNPTTHQMADVVASLAKVTGSQSTELSMGHWIKFGVIALIIQAIPCFFFTYIREMNLFDFPLFYLGAIVVGAAFLTYSYGETARVHAKKQRMQKISGDLEKSFPYAIFYANLIYLVSFMVLLKLISFNHLILNSGACVLFAGLLTSMVCSYNPTA